MAASAITPDEGQKVIADLIFAQANADRGTSLQLGLFTNTSGRSCFSCRNANNSNRASSSERSAS